MSKKVDCPKCLGVKELMEGKKEGMRGFEYSKCQFCDKDGKVDENLYNDYILSLDEDNVAFFDTD